MQAMLEAFWNLSVDMGIYILLGLLAAGVLHQFISEVWVQKHLGAKTHYAVIKAALFGAPLPLCSCSVIPFASTLRRSGASRGATLSFLISTPITGADALLATFGMFGGMFTLYRVVSSVTIAVVAGMLMNIFEPKEPEKTFTLSAIAPTFSVQPTAHVETSKKIFSLYDVFHYGLITLMGSFSKPLFWGLVLGAFITAAMPTHLQQFFGDNRWLGYLLSVAIAAPLYVCATASLPIAASLILAGASPGAAFIFLSAGPGTNTVTMGVVKSMLGTRALMIYLGMIVGGSIAFGALIDIGFDTLNVGMNVNVHEHHGWIQKGFAIVMLGLIAWHLTTGRLMKKDKSCNGGSCCS